MTDASKARSPSGKAKVCKTFIGGSILPRASNTSLISFLRFHVCASMRFRVNYRLAFLLVLLFGLGIREVAVELRPSFLRPDLHLFAYVGNVGDGTLSAIDLVRLRPVATINVGPGPTGVRAHPTRKEIWG